MSDGKIPIDQLVILYHEMERYSSRDSMRKELVLNMASSFGVSESTVRRALKSCGYTEEMPRTDYKSSRKAGDTEIRYYCELIAALQHGTTNKKGHHLSVSRAIDILENYGILVDDTLIKAPAGLLKKSTVYRYFQIFRLRPADLDVEPVVRHFEASFSNELWQFDFSESDQKVLKFPPGKLGDGKLRIISIIDDRSGAVYQEYLYTSGEDVLSALHFLFRAMSKKNGSFPHGIPVNIYMDNGSVAKSRIFKRAAELLGINVITHMPKGSDGRRTTARSKGKVERFFQNTKNSLESIYHYQPPENLSEANLWLKSYIGFYNRDMHRRENLTRMEVWKNNLPAEGIREMCSWDKFCEIVREPQTREVGTDACINLNGIKYQLDSDLAGESVKLLIGVFDETIHAELNGRKYGPFFPYNGPIPFGEYKKHKKTEKEKQSDRIDALSKKISIPKEVLLGKKRSIRELLKESEILADIKNIVFQSSDINPMNSFTDRIDAKLAIAKFLGKPLSYLSEDKTKLIECILDETLNKNSVLEKVKTLLGNKIEQETENEA
jgi:hypothetical protein